MLKLHHGLPEHEFGRETRFGKHDVEALRRKKELMPRKVLRLPAKVVHLQHAVPELLDVQCDGAILDARQHACDGCCCRRRRTWCGFNGSGG